MPDDAGLLTNLVMGQWRTQDFKRQETLTTIFIHRLAVVKKHSNTKHKYKQSKEKEETNSDQLRHVTHITCDFINDHRLRGSARPVLAAVSGQVIPRSTHTQPSQLVPKSRVNSYG